mmetsp:Transcript_18890/g.51994  ORF Transcript_18890/g.51994 Transcript_18890/m.51994 type:complete len:227 (-) Transcript_18890:579-1259(-)
MRRTSPRDRRPGHAHGEEHPKDTAQVRGALVPFRSRLQGDLPRNSVSRTRVPSGPCASLPSCGCGAGRAPPWPGPWFRTRPLRTSGSSLAKARASAPPRSPTQPPEAHLPRSPPGAAISSSAPAHDAACSPTAQGRTCRPRHPRHLRHPASHYCPCLHNRPRASVRSCRWSPSTNPRRSSPCTSSPYGKSSTASRLSAQQTSVELVASSAGLGFARRGAQTMPQSF